MSPKTLSFTVCSIAALILSAPAELLFSDNFDTADSASFDAAPTAGRLSGSAAADIVLRSWGAQQRISNNQLLMPAGGNSGVRFENAAGPFGGTNRYNWAGGTTGTAILSAGGFVVSFDWFPAGNTSTNWISFQAGTVNTDSGNLTDDDYGILFRQNGNTERFDNTVNLGAGGAFAASGVGVVRKVEITYEFGSFDDGTNVTATATVDGVEVASDTFTWDNNLGEMRMELGNNDANNRADNLTVSTIEPDSLEISLDGLTFLSTDPAGTAIGTLSAAFGNTPESATYSFAAGEGDTDNAKFQIAGDELQTGNSFDFSTVTVDTDYSLRIAATGDVSLESAEQVFVLTLVADSDTDGLPDSWELAFAADLTILDGRDDADADGDGITDADEYAMNPTAAPDGLDPTNPDSDGDDLEDGAELLAGTDPTNPDTDGDDVLDGIESGVGGDPLNKDTDGDGWSDGIEVASSSVVNNASSVPTFAPGVTVSLPIKTDCSSGISAAVNYTHIISGGDAVTVNGIDFTAMSQTVEPAGIIWDASGGKNVVINNLNTWQPANGGVTGAAMVSLLESFTYSGGGADPGSTQSFTLSGLTAGTTYDLRIYIRAWSTLTTRPVDINLANGDETIVATPEGGAPEDRPSEVLMNGGNDDQAYFVNFQYTAQGSEVSLNANVPSTAAATSGSFHLYGLTNEIAVGGASSDIKITSIARDISNPTAPVTITFESQPGVDYAVDFSTSLNAEGQPGGWLNLDDALSATGTSTSFTDTTVAPSGAARIFYRVRRP